MKYKVIELFSGCGGMALGFENAGLETKALVEIDKNAVPVNLAYHIGKSIIKTLDSEK